MVLQPCGHGCCQDCVRRYREVSVAGEVNCPQCREVVIEEKPNFDLIDMFPDESVTQEYWAQKLVELSGNSGQQYTLHVDVEIFAKLICSRIINRVAIQAMSGKEREEWTDEEKKLLLGIKQELRCCIAALEAEFENIMKWIEVMNYPSNIENYLFSHLTEMYETQKFLAPMDAEWLLDLIPPSV